MNQFREEIIAIVNSTSGGTLASAKISESMNWYQDGILDSLKQMRLILALEESLKVKFPFSKLGRQNFLNLNTLLSTLDSIANRPQ